MRAPSERWRGTLADIERRTLPHAGVYVLAYMGRVIYVGKAEDVAGRLYSHLTPAAGKLLVDDWLQNMGAFDAENVRLDVLVPPLDAGPEWSRAVEAACVRQLRPLMNVQLQLDAA